MLKKRVIVGKLREWRKQICGPDGLCVFWGRIYGDILNRFPNGQFIHTAYVASIDGDLITTQNGHVYQLVGTPTGNEVNTWE
jgi:hypothetical protein